MHPCMLRCATIFFVGKKKQFQVASCQTCFNLWNPKILQLFDSKILKNNNPVYCKNSVILNWGHFWPHLWKSGGFGRLCIQGLNFFLMSFRAYGGGNINHQGIIYGVMDILLNKNRLFWSGTYKSYRATMNNSNMRQGCNCTTMQLLNLS